MREGRPRVAVVGAGLMGRWHAAYAARASSMVAAIVDPDRRAAAELRRRHRAARTFDTLNECLAAESIDVVHVCTPVKCHAAVIETALRAGKHVLAEKPLAETAADTSRLLALAGEAGVRLGVVHQFPWQRGFRRVRRHLDRLGQPIRLAFQACTAGGEGRSAAERLDLLLEICPHPWSLFFALVGPRLLRAGWQVLRYTNDSLIVHGRLDGLSLEIAIDLLGRPPRNELMIMGTQATAHVDLYHGCSVLERGGNSRCEKIVRPLARSIVLLAAASVNLAERLVRWEPAYPGLMRLIGAFHESVTTRRPVPPVAAEILGTATFLDQVRQQRPSEDLCAVTTIAPTG